MTEHRDRSEGWKYAKLSGHSNEELVCAALLREEELQMRLLRAVSKPEVSVTACSYGGLHETDVPSILGGRKTKSKADLLASFSDETKVGVSVKKSLGGQVFLIRDENFIRGFELQYGKQIPEGVKRAIRLFWGSAEDAKGIVEAHSEGEVKRYELHKNRLTAETLMRYDAGLAAELIRWFRENIAEVTDYCFGRGQVRDAEHMARVVWYKNLLGEHEVDEMYRVEDLCEMAVRGKDVIEFGTQGGGTTITLPFGFVQWHQGQMQFHHKYKTIWGFGTPSF